MTAVADNKKRVLLRSAKPGVPLRGTAKVRIEKRGQYHVGVLDPPINEEALKDAVAEFP